ncbi:50S ribosomal protein L24 [Aspergillus campestris IBT 28561]|uniref:Large ribosomal subunit protein bL28m n=1 Tax=Aspergillus campestris (strain IBT 28561) TaxID=1392248 RepID=A0A2I1CYC4_ASPC2|nr:50S ribosomal protein L24 [Aspergillus campestris IBT 28561]PKY02637.1 50S ribosomal protein L24 [Aspergillus campestris IBT 28561]
MAGLQARSSMSLPSSLSAAFRNISLNTSKRSFSSTPVTQKTRTLPEYIPPYPFGPKYVYKQADSGLYGGVQISFGNKISQGRNEGKTRRSWKPNVRRKKIHSEALGEDLFIKVTRKALRTIRKAGGLDQYLLDDRPGRVRELGMFGWELRWRVMQTPKIQEQFKQERKRLGLPEPPTFEEWVKQKEAELKAQAEEDQTNIKEATKPFYNKQLY